MRKHRRPVRGIELCLYRPAVQPPAGPGWMHEIKNDGFRILAQLDAVRTPEGIERNPRGRL